jgi:hypothetical protein
MRKVAPQIATFDKWQVRRSRILPCKTTKTNSSARHKPRHRSQWLWCPCALKNSFHIFYLPRPCPALKWVPYNF